MFTCPLASLSSLTDNVEERQFFLIVVGEGEKGGVRPGDLLETLEQVQRESENGRMRTTSVRSDQL